VGQPGTAALALFGEIVETSPRMPIREHTNSKREGIMYMLRGTGEGERERGEEGGWGEKMLNAPCPNAQ